MPLDLVPLEAAVVADVDLAVGADRRRRSGPPPVVATRSTVPSGDTRGERAATGSRRRGRARRRSQIGPSGNCSPDAISSMPVPIRCPPWIVVGRTVRSAERSVKTELDISVTWCTLTPPLRGAQGESPDAALPGRPEQGVEHDMAVTRAEAIAALTAPGQPFELETIERRGRAAARLHGAPASMRDFLASTAAFGDRDFLVYDGERTTTPSTSRSSPASPRWLAASRASARATASPSACATTRSGSISFWATMALGAIAVPLNAWWLGPELEYADHRLAARKVAARSTASASSGWRRTSPPSAPTSIVVCRHRGDVPAGVVRWEDLRPTLDTHARPARRRRSRPTTTPRSSTRRAPPAPRRARWRRTATTSRTS